MGELSPFQQLQDELKDTDTIVKEVSQGRRIGYYKLGGILGKGAFSEVKLGMHILLDEKVAVKIVEKGKHGAQSTLNMVRQETKVMERLNHPNIITLFEIIETLDKFYCIMEYVDGGSLQEYITARNCVHKSVSENQARFFFTQILDAVEHMHSKGISHRDLKPENIMLCKSDKTIRVADFGISSTNPGPLKDMCGTPSYTPPQIFQKVPYRGALFDIWSLGCLLFHLLDGHPPFRAHRMSEMKLKIVNVEYTMPEKFGDDLKDMISKIIVAEPKSRLTIEGMRAHPWMDGAPENEMCAPGEGHDSLARERLLSLGLSNKTLENLAPAGVEPRDAVTGTYRIAFQRTQTEQVLSDLHKKAPRFSEVKSVNEEVEIDDMEHIGILEHKRGKGMGCCVMS